MTQHEKTIKFNQEKKEGKQKAKNRESEEMVGKMFAEGRKKIAFMWVEKISMSLDML